MTQDCETAGIKPDVLMLFSKSGYSSELKSMKNENLKLFTVKHLKQLV